jgi:hypothetical protein
MGVPPGWRAVAVRLLLAAGVAMSLAPLAAAARGRVPEGGAAAVQAPPAAKITVTLEAVATSRTGATDRPQTTVGRTIAIGDRIREGFTAGGESHDLCELASVPGGEGGETAEGTVRWTIEATLESADANSVTLAIAWQRSVVASAAGGRTLPMSDQRTVRLRPDDVHVLDLVQAEAGSASACANVLIRVRAARAEPAILVRTWQTYDLWLVYEGARGDGATRHLELAGPEDAPLSFQFAPLRWDLNGALAAAKPQAGVAVGVLGTVQGRCRADGAVDVTLDTLRRFAFGETAKTGSGRKQFVLGPGDTVAVEIPNPTARLTAPGTALARALQPWAPGVESSADIVAVNPSEFFRGSRARVLISGRCE